jgi:hypothetical protein
VETWTICDECEETVYLKDTVSTERGYQCADTLICQRRKEVHDRNRDDAEKGTERK